MEILMGVMLVVGLISNKCGPKHYVTELSDGTKVYMKAGTDWEKEGRKAVARVEKSDYADRREQKTLVSDWTE
jgi:hypothetical protein